MEEPQKIIIQHIFCGRIYFDVDLRPGAGCPQLAQRRIDGIWCISEHIRYHVRGSACSRRNVVALR